MALDSAAYADVPSHEQLLHWCEQYKEEMDTHQSGLLTDPDLDLDAAIPELEANLTAIFEENAE